MKKLQYHIKKAYNATTMENVVENILTCFHNICVISTMMYDHIAEYYVLANISWECYYGFYMYAFDRNISLRPLLKIPSLIEHCHLVKYITPEQEKSLRWYLINNWKLYLMAVSIIPIEGNECGNIMRIVKFRDDTAVCLIKNVQVVLPLSTKIVWRF